MIPARKRVCRPTAAGDVVRRWNLRYFILNASPKPHLVYYRKVWIQAELFTNILVPATCFGPCKVSRSWDVKMGVEKVLLCRLRMALRIPYTFRMLC